MNNDVLLPAVVSALSAGTLVSTILFIIARVALREALHDSLTRLPNRDLWEIQALERFRRLRSAAVFVIDVNGLKRVNDVHGHHFGDRLIEEFARELRQVFGPRALIGRLGGDEFAVLLELKPEERSRVIAAVDRCVVTVCGVESSAGFGVAQLSDLDADSRLTSATTAVDDRTALSRLMRAADLALLRAKAICRSTNNVTALAFYQDSDGRVPADFGTTTVPVLLRRAVALLGIRAYL